MLRIAMPMGRVVVDEENTQESGRCYVNTSHVASIG
jgi:hypothetical protein